VKIIIAGVGSVTDSMCRSVKQKKWFNIAAVIDSDLNQLLKFKNKYKLNDNQLFTNYEHVIKCVKADAIWINTPSQFHYSQIKFALKNVKHILVAKPFVNNYEQAKEIVNISKDIGATITVGQQMRYQKHFKELQSLINTDILGEIEYISFHNSKNRNKLFNLKNFDHPVLFEMSCHHFDNLYSLFNDLKPEYVYCQTFKPSWSIYKGDCMVNALIKFNNNIHLNYHAGYSSQSSNYTMRFEGSKGVLKYNGIHMSKNIGKYSFAKNGSKFENIPTKQFKHKNSPWSDFLVKWFEYTNNYIDQPFTGKNNIKILKLINACVQSTSLNLPIIFNHNSNEL